MKDLSRLGIGIRTMHGPMSVRNRSASARETGCNKPWIGSFEPLTRRDSGSASDSAITLNEAKRATGSPIFDQAKAAAVRRHLAGNNVDRNRRRSLVNIVDRPHIIF